jgi:superfamily I DNA/RNA helicase
MREQISDQYRYIMVDEYQDTNKLQAQIVKLMTARHDNVAVVGDEFQSIYSFRGASHRNMLEFPKLFPSAQIIKLEENFPQHATDSRRRERDHCRRERELQKTTLLAHRWSGRRRWW